MSTEDYDRYGMRLDGSRQLSMRNRKHLRQVPSSTPRRDVAMMPPQPPTSHHQIQPENRQVEKQRKESQPSPDLDRQEVVQSEPKEKETAAVQPNENQQQPPAVQEFTPPRTPTTPDRPRRSNAGKTRRYDNFVMCNCRLKYEASASQRWLRDSPSPMGGGA